MSDIKLEENNCVPLYYQLKEIFIEKIKSNEWKVNSKIPTERELCEIYNVSRITVRNAISELERVGYIYRKQGKGTFVARPKIEQRLSKFYSFSDELRKMGYTPSSKILAFDLIEADSVVGEKLGIEKGSKVYSLKRLRYADGIPIIFEISYIPYDICPGLNEKDISLNGLYQTMANNFSVENIKAEEAFEAVLMNKEEAEYLNVKKNVPGLRLERLAFMANGKISEYCISIIRGDKYKYKVKLI